METGSDTYEEDVDEAEEEDDEDDEDEVVSEEEATGRDDEAGEGDDWGAAVTVEAAIEDEAVAAAKSEGTTTGIILGPAARTTFLPRRRSPSAMRMHATGTGASRR